MKKPVVPKIPMPPRQTIGDPSRDHQTTFGPPSTPVTPQKPSQPSDNGKGEKK